MWGSRRYKILMILMSTAVILVLAYGLGAGSLGGRPAMGPPMIPVTVMRAKKEPLLREENLTGRVVAYQVAEIRPQVTGIITERLFEEGSSVNEGQQLYQIDAAPYEAAYNSAKADVAKSEANVKALQAKAERYETLIKSRAVSQQDYDDVIAKNQQAQAEVGISKAALETAAINLKYTKVYAPISGYIGKSEVTKGALVTANQASIISRITQLDPVYVDFTESIENASEMHQMMKANQGVKITLFLEKESEPYPHEGTLEFADVTVNPTTGSVIVRALFPNPHRALLPGMFVRARLALPPLEIVAVPLSAVIRDKEGSTKVWVVDEHNSVMLKPVTLIESGEKAGVSEGLMEGDRIVIEGFQKLMPGVLVQPEERGS